MSSSSSLTTTSAAAVQTVLNYKEVLEKEVAKSKDDIDVERCSDILDQLLPNQMKMTYTILNETLIGVTVNKLKSNVTLQPKVKALIKAWKQIANAGTATTSTTTPPSTKPPSSNGKSKKPEETKKSSNRKQPENKDDTINGEEEDGDDDDMAVITIDPATAFAHLHEAPRISLCQKLYLIFQKQESQLIQEAEYHPSTIPTLLYNQCIEMERAIHAIYYTKKHNDKKGYADKARSLLFNLNKNRTLTMSLLLGSVLSSDLVQYTTEQLANEQMQLLRQETTQKLIDSKRLDWNEANEDKINNMCGISGDLLNASLFTCGRCKSIKTTSTQKQTRSADEPMTVFVLCLNCGKRWKC